jgi:hypothetical protein
MAAPWSAMPPPSCVWSATSSERASADTASGASSTSRHRVPSPAPPNWGLVQFNTPRRWSSKCDAAAMLDITLNKKMLLLQSMT